MDDILRSEENFTARNVQAILDAQRKRMRRVLKDEKPAPTSPKNVTARRFFCEEREKKKILLFEPSQIRLFGETHEWYSVSLSQKPLGNVRISVSFSNNVQLEPSVLHFGRDLWNVPQRICVRPRPPFDEMRAASTSIAHYVVSSDPLFNFSQKIAASLFKAASPSLVSFGSDGQPGEKGYDDIRQLFPRDVDDRSDFSSDEEEELSSREYSLKLKGRIDARCKEGDSDKVLGMAAGNRLSLYVCYDGTVYAVAKEKRTAVDFSRVTSFPGRVVVFSVSCGSEHSAAVSTSGECFVWGDNSCGQLGLGDTVPRTAPERVPNVRGVKKVSCGMFHTMASTQDQLFGWGHKLNGALGLAPKLSLLEDEHCELSPVAVQTTTTGEEVAQVSCGDFHTAIVTTTGVLMTCGMSDSGQLGRDQEQNTWLFRPVRLPRKKNNLVVVSVSCGGMHTLVLTSSREVFVFGNNRVGQLGLGDQRPRSRPCRLDALSEADDPVCGITAGQAYSAAWTESGLAYAWGEATCGQLGTRTEEMSHRNHVACPCLLPSLSHARCRGIVFGTTHTLAMTDLRLSVVRKLVSTSRQFYKDTAAHFRLLAAASRQKNSMARRLWLRRRKAFKLVDAVDFATLANRRTSAKTIKAARAAKLTQVLQFDPRHSRTRNRELGISTRKQLRLAARIDSTDKLILSAQLQRHWFLTKYRGYRHFCTESERSQQQVHALRIALPLVLSLYSYALHSRPIRAVSTWLREAYDYELLDIVERKLKDKSSSSSFCPIVTTTKMKKMAPAPPPQIYRRRASFEAPTVASLHNTCGGGERKAVEKKKKRKKNRRRRPASATPILFHRRHFTPPKEEMVPPVEVDQRHPPPRPAPSLQKKKNCSSNGAFLSSRRQMRCRENDVRPHQFAPVLRRERRDRHGALSMEELQEIMLHVCRIKEIVAEHPLRV